MFKIHLENRKLSVLRSLIRSCCNKNICISRPFCLFIYTPLAVGPISFLKSNSTAAENLLSAALKWFKLSSRSGDVTASQWCVGTLWHHSGMWLHVQKSKFPTASSITDGARFATFSFELSFFLVKIKLFILSADEKMFFFFKLQSQIILNLFKINLEPDNKAIIYLN